MAAKSTSVLDLHREKAPLPPLFGTLKRDFPGRGGGGEIITLKAGQRVRVIDAGPFGCVGITLLLDETKRDQARAVLSKLTAFSSTPSTPN